MAYFYPTVDDLSPEDRAEVSAVLAALRLTVCGDQPILDVHRVLEQVRARARAR